MRLEREEKKMAEKKAAHFRETMERLTAASHVQTEYFGDHKRIEGYYESQMTGRMFGCDRLLKQENLFGRLQLGYNPNRERVFLFAHLKTSRYDTVASRYQKELKEYQQKSLLKGDNENRAYVSRYWQGASVLIEKRENKPWTRRSIASYLGRENMEAVQKTLPFFRREEETRELKELRARKKQIEEELRGLQQEERLPREEQTERAQRSQQAGELRQEAVAGSSKEELLEALLIRKDAASRQFLRRMNYAYDFQKKDIESYYRERKKTLGQVKAETAGEPEGPEDSEE